MQTGMAIVWLGLTVISACKPNTVCESLRPELVDLRSSAMMPGCSDYRIRICNPNKVSEHVPVTFLGGLFYSKSKIDACDSSESFLAIREAEIFAWKEIKAGGCEEFVLSTKTFKEATFYFPIDSVSNKFREIYLKAPCD